MASIQLPGWKPQERKEQKKDPLDMIQQGLQIAASAYGIYADSEKLDLARKTQSQGSEATALEIQERQSKLSQSQNADAITQDRLLELTGPKGSFDIASLEDPGVISMPLKSGGNVGLIPRKEAAKGLTPYEQAQLDLKREELALKRQENSNADNRKITAQVVGDQRKTLAEARVRAENIQKKTDELKALVKANGTNVLTGPEGHTMDALIQELAIEQAKLVDPQSVAREGEVEAMKKLLPFREWGGMGMSNDTALSLITDFNRRAQNVVASRADELQKFSGVQETPLVSAPPTVRTSKGDIVVTPEMQARARKKLEEMSRNASR